jgi:hypothetical protein
MCMGGIRDDITNEEALCLTFIIDVTDVAI